MLEPRRVEAIGEWIRDSRHSLVRRRWFHGRLVCVSSRFVCVCFDSQMTYGGRRRGLFPFPHLEHLRRSGFTFFDAVCRWTLTHPSGGLRHILCT